MSLFSPRPAMESFWFTMTADSLAWALFVTGAAFRFWATLYIGGRKDKTVAFEGPYSLCRHPLYFGSLLLMGSMVLFLRSLVLALAWGIVYLFYTLGTIPIEEQALLTRFGDAYLEYRERVPRLWPSLRRFHTRQRIELDVHALRLECARASRWIWLPLYAEVITRLQRAAWWPHWFQVW
ncbi:MAG: isoprenylcysteine carboxylmethyltransferase family protein [Cyanobacteria bacterium]|nr:isoprenylcysteine carboxylmethyltransferase family protein [Cyanobacteriota bacterium]